MSGFEDPAQMAEALDQLADNLRAEAARYRLPQSEPLAGLKPVCPLERNHDTLRNPECWACGLIQGLWTIATATGGGGDPKTEARIALDENIDFSVDLTTD